MGKYLQTTWLLGYFTVFFLILECVTGAMLMVYYAPTPAEAYGSIIALITEVPFGWLIRDLHRLGGELMLIFATLHLIRVFLVGAYTASRRITWVTGILLWVLIMLLTFSGYLLPWDQLAYWAVTIGTSIVEPLPVVGKELTMLLRGGPIFGGNGLLRFYLLHIFALPLLVLPLVAIHYYRVSRLHGVLLNSPIDKQTSLSKKEETSFRTPFLPTIPLMDTCLALATLILLIVACTWFYDAPLQHHADPLHTPAMTRAPWFFLWLQGLLKLGDRLLMGIVFPALTFVILLSFPYLMGTRPSRFSRPVRVAITIVIVTVLVSLSYLGLPQNVADSPTPQSILEQFHPEEGSSPFHTIPYSELAPGIYLTTDTDLPDSPIADLLIRFRRSLVPLATNDDQVVRGVMVIEEWQADLKRISLRIHLEDTSGTRAPVSYEKKIYRHQDHNASLH